MFDCMAVLTIFLLSYQMVSLVARTIFQNRGDTESLEFTKESKSKILTVEESILSESGRLLLLLGCCFILSMYLTAEKSNRNNECEK